MTDSKVENVPHVPLNIKGTNIRDVLDTGSKHNIISGYLARKLGLDIVRDKQVSALKLLNETHIKIFGKTQVQITLHKCIYVLSFALVQEEFGYVSVRIEEFSVLLPNWYARVLGTNEVFSGAELRGK